MTKYYNIQDLLTWNTVKLNEIAIAVSDNEPKNTINMNGKDVPIWYILALNIKITFEIQKHIKENGITIPELELDFEEINEQFKKLDNEQREHILAEHS